VRIFKKRAKKRNIPLPIGHIWGGVRYDWYNLSDWHRLTYECSRCGQLVSKYYPFKNDKRYFWINSSHHMYINNVGVFVKSCYGFLMDEALR